MKRYRIEKSGNDLLLITPDETYIWEDAGDDWLGRYGLRETVVSQMQCGDRIPTLGEIIRYLASHPQDGFGPASHCDKHGISHQRGHVCRQCIYQNHYDEARDAGYSPNDAEIEAKLGDGPAD